jgi:biopolymer transport protein ExbB
MIAATFAELQALFALGGPIVVLLAMLSVVALAVIFYKLWDLWMRPGPSSALEAALADWDRGERARAAAALGDLRSPFAPVIAAAMEAGDTPAATERVETMAEAAVARYESGFRLLDAVAQTAPLLGLFGTVLGMIEAFQAMQGAGTSVDPSVLAGGIWVALLTTAVGLAVAIPAALALTWFEGRVARQRSWLAGALTQVRAPKAGSRAALAPGARDAA